MNILFVRCCATLLGFLCVLVLTSCQQPFSGINSHCRSVFPSNNHNGNYVFKSMSGVRGVGPVILADKGKLDDSNGLIKVKSGHVVTTFVFPDDFVNCSSWLNTNLMKRYDAFTIYRKQAFAIVNGNRFDNIPVRSVAGDYPDRAYNMYISEWNDEDEKLFEETKKRLEMMFDSSSFSPKWISEWEEKVNSFMEIHRKSVRSPNWIHILIRIILDETSKAYEEAILKTQNDKFWKNVRDETKKTLDESMHNLHETFRHGKRKYIIFDLASGYMGIPRVSSDAYDISVAFDVPEDEVFLVPENLQFIDPEIFNCKIYRALDLTHGLNATSGDGMVIVEVTDLPEIANVILWNLRTTTFIGLIRVWYPPPFVLVKNSPNLN